MTSTAVPIRSWSALPDTRGHRRLVLAMLMDAFGNGAFLPFALVFYLAQTSLSLDRIGVALTVSAALAIPVGPLLGRAADRVGVIPFLIAANLFQGVAFLAYPAISGFVTLTVLTAAAAVAGEAYWTGNAVLIATVSSGDETAKWFALQRMARNLGLGLGALVSGVALSGVADQHHVLLAVVVGNAMTYFASAALITSWRRQHRQLKPVPTADAEVVDQAAPPVPVHRSLAFWAVAALTVIVTIGGMAPSLLWAIYMGSHLGMPPWTVGLMFALNTAMVVLLQLSATAWVARFALGAQLAAALVVWSASFVALAAMGMVPGRLWLPLMALVILTAAYTLGEIVLAPALGVLQIRNAPQDALGAYLGAYQAAFTTAAVLTPAILTVAAGADQRVPWLVLAALTACAIPLGLGQARAALPVPLASQAPAETRKDA